MASIEPLLIICDEPIIHKPKPKRIHKIQNNTTYNNNGLFNHRLLKPKTSRINNHHENKNNKIKNKQKKLSFNLDLISLEEIENDFNDFKSKSEEIEVQKELITLLKKTNNNGNCYRRCINFGKNKRPINPIYKDYELAI